MSSKTFISIITSISILFIAAIAYASPFTSSGEQQLLNKEINAVEQNIHQTTKQIEYLYKQLALPAAVHADKRYLAQLDLFIASTKNILAEVDIELKYRQQSLIWLDKNIQEIHNQLHALTVFGSKDTKDQQQDWQNQLQQAEEEYQRAKYYVTCLSNLQMATNTSLNLYNQQYTKINEYLHEQEAKATIAAQVAEESRVNAQQKQLINKLFNLYSQAAKHPSIANSSAIFYLTETLNHFKFQRLLKQYQDNIYDTQQALTNLSSASMLEFNSDQIQYLSKQLSKLTTIIQEHAKLIATGCQDTVNAKLLHSKLPEQYSCSMLQESFTQLHNQAEMLNTTLTDLRAQLERNIKNTLSARQGLPGFSASAWLDLSKEILSLPSLSYKLIKGLIVSLINATKETQFTDCLILFITELCFLGSIFVIHRYLKLRQYQQYSKRLSSKIIPWFINIVTNKIWSIAIIANIYWLLNYLIPANQYLWLIKILLVWLVFSWIHNLTRAGLVETFHTSTGNDMQLYRGLKIVYACGLIITTITLFLHQLPLVYEVIDLCDRLFLLLMAVVSCMLLYYWRVTSSLVNFYLKSQRSYITSIIKFMSVFIPLVLLVNAMVGLLGFTTLVWVIIWYEGIFIIVLLSYCILRGLLSEAIDVCSMLIINNIPSGWLWTQAILKPLHSVLGLLLFLMSWLVLFVLYGWNEQSRAVERLSYTLHYPLLSILNTTITSMSIMKLTIAGSVFYWAARWTREFVFRMLTKISDIGMRNSIAILSQYTVIVSGTIVCLELLGIDLHELFLVASGLLIAIGFGIRDLVNNFACGLLLLFERPVRVGDIISIDSYEGTVTNIGGRAVTIRTSDHIEVIVPNTTLFNKSFSNWTVADDVIRTVINVKVDRLENPYLVKNLIHEVLSDNTNILSHPTAAVLVNNVVDNYHEFSIKYYIKLSNVSSHLAVRSEVLLQLWHTFHVHNIRIPKEQIYIR